MSKREYNGQVNEISSNGIEVCPDSGEFKDF